MNILVDKDGVLYDLHTPWYIRHNKEFGHIHTITKEDIVEFDTVATICAANNCPANIFSYFDDASLWLENMVIPQSQAVTRRWLKAGHNMVVITHTASPNSASASWWWLKKNFPHIPDIMMVTTPIKHWAIADILIDDAPHNHIGFQGISILLDQPWNRRDKLLPRAYDWNDVERIVNRAERYIDHYADIADDNAHQLWAHKWIQQRLKVEMEEGII